MLIVTDDASPAFSCAAPIPSCSLVARSRAVSPSVWGRDYDEFFSAVADRDVHFAKAIENESPYEGQRTIAFRMTKIVVDGLEVVDIDEEGRKGEVIALRTSVFFTQTYVHDVS